MAINKLHRAEFLKVVKAAFPGLRGELNREYGSLNLEVQVFARFTQAQIDAGNADDVAQCFSLVNRFLLLGDTKLVNALFVSYLEHLNLRDGKVARQWALELMPPALLQGYRDITAYMEQFRTRRTLKSGRRTR